MLSEQFFFFFSLQCRLQNAPYLTRTEAGGLSPTASAPLSFLRYIVLICAALCFFRRIFGRCSKRGRTISTGCCPKTEPCPVQRLEVTFSAHSFDSGQSRVCWSLQCLSLKRTTRWYFKHAKPHSSPNSSHTLIPQRDNKLLLSVFVYWKCCLCSEF